MSKVVKFLRSVVLIIGISIGVLLVLSLSGMAYEGKAQTGFEYVIDDFTFYPIPNIPKPEKGVTFQDPNFHTDITRITDALTDVGETNRCQSGYPTTNIENADGTMIFIWCDDWWENRWYIFNANTYQNIKPIPAEYIDTPNFGYHDPDLRWDNTNPNIFYSTARSKFYKCNASTDPVSCIELHDFQDDFPDEDVRRVYTKEKGDASDDRRHWAFVIRCYDGRTYDTAVVVYDKDYYGEDNGRIISVLDDADPLFHGAIFSSMSPSGNYVLLGGSDSHYVYPRDFSSERSMGCSGHSDSAISAEGREVVVCRRGGSWHMVDMETGEDTQLAPVGGDLSFHISGNSHDKPGWAVISTYSPFYPQQPDDWREHSVYMIELTTRTDPPPRVWRIAHTHTAREEYADDPFAKLNKRGTKIWFGSGWGQPLSQADAQYDVYQVDLPDHWYEDLMGTECLRGDLNCDGNINVLDVQLCGNVFSGAETDPEITGRADVNPDGSVNASDVQQIVEILLER